jgi:hypothetical protein
MPDNNQGNYPGEGHHYGPNLGNEPPTMYPTGLGPDGKLRVKQKSAWRVVALVFFITTLIFLGTTALAYNHIIGAPVKATPVANTANATQVVPTTATSAPTVAATATSAAASTSTTPSATQAGVSASPTASAALLTKNITLTCGGCNDPVHVTIDTIQIDTTNGRMIWNTTLRDVTGSGRPYGIQQYSIQASASQTSVPAVLSQASMDGANKQYDVQGTFAFVPFRNVTYTLSVVVYFNASTGETTITFDPLQVTF